MHTSTIALVVAFLLVNVSAFFQPRFGARTSISSHVVARRALPLAMGKPDLFSDDLFDDDDAAPSKDLVKDDAESPKRKYLDQKWKLNSEDAKEFKGFPKKDGSGSEGKVPDIVPCFALMYKFRKEYIENSCDEALADHRGYCAKFKRVLNSEVINLGTTRGVVLLWAGFTETDSAETKAEIMSFLEEDPLIVKDIVENWDLINFTDRPAGGKSKTLPSAEVKA